MHQVLRLRWGRVVGVDAGVTAMQGAAQRPAAARTGATGAPGAHSGPAIHLDFDASISTSLPFLLPSSFNRPFLVLFLPSHSSFHWL